MLKNIIILLLCTFLFIPVGNIYANNNIGEGTKVFFQKYTKKIQKKYPKDKGLNYYKKLNDKLILLRDKGILKEEQNIIINELIILINERIFDLELINIEKANKIKLNISDISKKFKIKSYNKDFLFKEDGIWYSYNYNGYLSFPKGSNIKIEDLNYNGIDINTDIVFIMESGDIGFIKTYQKIKLISDNIIYGIPNKYNFLYELKRDKKYIQKDSDQTFIDIKNTTLELIKGLSTKEEKIKIIYSYMLKNVSYTKKFTLEDYEIFSGIETFERNTGVCDGYVKLFTYMLTLAGIGDSEVIRGFVLNAKDFPRVGHAWVRIGDYYYDPTFDDPIGPTKDRNSSEFIYYKLPFDLIYTNRFKYEEIPEFLKTATLEYREKLIYNNLSKLAKKYKNSNYLLIKPFAFKDKYNIDYSEKVTINDLKNEIKFAEIENFVFKLNGITKNISSLQYYTINDDNAESIASQLKFNFDDYILFKWKLENGNNEYRLAYNIVYN